MSKDQTFPCIEQDHGEPLELTIKRLGSPIMVKDRCSRCTRTISRSLTDKLSGTMNAGLGEPIALEFQCECGIKPWIVIVRLFLRAGVDRP